MQLPPILHNAYPRVTPLPGRPALFGSVLHCLLRTADNCPVSLEGHALDVTRGVQLLCPLQENFRCVWWRALQDNRGIHPSPLLSAQNERHAERILAARLRAGVPAGRFQRGPAAACSHTGRSGRTWSRTARHTGPAVAHSLHGNCRVEALAAACSSAGLEVRRTAGGCHPRDVVSQLPATSSVRGCRGRGHCEGFAPQLHGSPIRRQPRAEAPRNVCCDSAPRAEVSTASSSP